MSKPKRRRYTPEQKAAVLRRHLADKIPVSDLCDEVGIQPSVFYTWQRQLLENLSAALEDGRRNRGAETTELEREQKKVEALESKLVRKNDVIAEISQELIELKKSIVGGAEEPMGPPRHPRCGRRLPEGVGGENRTPPGSIARLGSDSSRPVLRLEQALREGERAQRQDSS